MEHTVQAPSHPNHSFDLSPKSPPSYQQRARDILKIFDSVLWMPRNGAPYSQADKQHLESISIKGTCVMTAFDQIKTELDRLTERADMQIGAMRGQIQWYEDHKWDMEGGR